MQTVLEDKQIADFTISDFFVTSGNASGLHLSDCTVEIDLDKYTYLKDGQKEQLVLTYNLTSHFGAEISQIAVFLLTAQRGKFLISAANSNNLLARQFSTPPQGGKVKIALFNDDKRLAC